MEVPGQHHALAGLLLVKEPPVPIGQEAGWVPQPVWAFWRGEEFLATAGIEPRSGGLQAHSHSTI